MIVYVAATAGDADRVARLFDDAGIAYSERLDAALAETEGRVCYLGTVFEVDAGIAERCRQLLRDEGYEPV
ncbi:MAG TPA: hypothetical protein VLU46_17180 [Thermoanaerobaculia bacterium]|nr:hypothetical protein [Thermoanaerobaculia bacterium]